MNAGGVELPKFHIFQWNAGTCRHAQSIAGIDKGVGGSRKNTSRATGCQQGGFCFKDVNVASFHLQRSYADDVARLITNQVHGQPLNEKAGSFFHVLLVQRVQHGVTRAVGRCTGALNWFFAVIGGVATKRTLVNSAVGVAVKRHAHVLKVIHHLGCFTTHELDRVLVTKPVGAFHGVVKVVVPIVFGHIAQRRPNSPLRCNGV